jgi:fructosamine-3-kinase
MARAGGIAHRAETLLGTAVVATSPVAGGDICTATRLKLSNGGAALVKTRPNAPADFFRTEAAGLVWLAEAGGAPTPEVLAVEDDCLILDWVEGSRPTGDAAESFGRALAATHAKGADGFGTSSGEDGYIGTLPLPNRDAQGWPEFYATRRVLPYLKLARDRGHATEDDATAVEAVIGRLPELLVEESPSRLHGDLWNGNVLWGQEGRVWLVDPAAYGGHRELDLAMLALFGLPHLPRVVEAYQESAPLAEGWEERVSLHQLFPLLVHAALFGGGYGASAERAARHYAA